ncbi:hypothetical protein LINGRAHAP2_LOCUS4247, partial [Linum grandiflorum]
LFYSLFLLSSDNNSPTAGIIAGHPRRTASLPGRPSPDFRLRRSSPPHRVLLLRLLHLQFRFPIVQRVHPCFTIRRFTSPQSTLLPLAELQPQFHPHCSADGRFSHTSNTLIHFPYFWITLQTIWLHFCEC